MKLSYAIDGVFPTPIYRSYLKRNFTKEEQKNFKEQSNQLENNTGNLITKDKYILDKPNFKKLKLDIMEHVKEYSRVILNLQGSELYMTQSWLNFTQEYQFHHIHAHPNSIVSGVLYIDSDVEYDSITFFKEGYMRIRPAVNQFHLFNATDWKYPVKTKDLLLFPSELVHKVSGKKGKNTRISLAFNTFIKGELGSLGHVDKLVL